MKVQVFKPMEFCTKCNCYYEKHCSEHFEEKKHTFASFLTTTLIRQTQYQQFIPIPQHDKKNCSN